MHSWVKLPAELIVPAFFTIKKDSDIVGYHYEVIKRKMICKQFCALEQKFEQDNKLQLKEYFCKDGTWAVEEFLTLFRYTHEGAIFKKIF